ncbi:MlaD family protein [Nocardia anaemiae]|uniref:MlaD family protein n=1 Tax=Nocardia anaemiae TaxID=263910 RepID=UPI0007A3E9FB|nr:MlaD family protein [Nocardia anaemiae]
MKTFGRLVPRVAAALFCGAVTAACSLGPKDIPSFQSSSGGADIVLHFASVMNLPDGATVTMDGLPIGKVARVDLGASDVAVTVTLSPGVRVPSNVKATIRQDTILGDTYIGLDRSAAQGDTRYLPTGGSVPVGDTTSPPQLEDTLAVLAYFVNGGSIQKIEDAMSRLNTVMPAVSEIRKLSTVITGDLHDLSQNTGEIDRTLAGFDRTSSVVADNSATLNRVLLNDWALQYWNYSARVMYGAVGKGLPSIGSLFVGGSWMVPMLNSLSETTHEGRGIWDTAPSAAGNMATFLRTVVLPFAQHPSVNIRSVQAANGDQLVGDIENVLRMLGAVR